MRLKVHHETQARTVGERPDGRTAAAITGRFRQRFRQALLMLSVGPLRVNRGRASPRRASGARRWPRPRAVPHSYSPAPIMSYSPVFAPNF